MTSSTCDRDISARLQRCSSEFINAYSAGKSADFYTTWAALCDDIEAAQTVGAVSLRTLRLAHTVSGTIKSLASRFGNIESRTCHLGAELQQKAQLVLDHPARSPEPPNFPASSPGLPFLWVEPLLQFTIAHISSPYPSADQKQALLERCAAAGWSNITQRKLEDWMNATRNRMGYTRILKSDTVGDDRAVMEDYVRRVLSGRPSDTKGIPSATVRSIQAMQLWLLGQQERRAAKDQTSSWARDVVQLVQTLRSARAISTTFDKEGDDADDDSSESSSEGSDSDTLYSDSDTDVEDDACVSPTSVLGAKRKYFGLGLGQPPARTVSSTLFEPFLGSHGTLADCEVSDTPCTLAQSDGQLESDRPAKRRRSSLDSSSDEEASCTLTAVAESPSAKVQVVEQPYRSQKRKRAASEDERSPSSKRARQLDQAVLSAQVPLADIDALTSFCQLDWDASLSLVGLTVDVDLDWDGDIIDTPQPDDDLHVDDSTDVAVDSCESADDAFVDTSIAWCKLQVYVLERMLRHGVHVVPPPDASPAGSTPTIMVDASLFNSEELAYLDSLSMEDPGVGQACVETPDLLGPGPNCPDAIGLSQWSVDLSDPTPPDGTALPSVDIDEWIASLLNEPFST